MNRDGAKFSIWQNGLPNYTPQNFTLEESYDVVIVGGGITGLATAVELQKKGKKCLIAEAQNLGFGTTSGTTAHLNTMPDTYYFEIEKDFGKDASKQLFKSVTSSLNLIKENVESFNINCDLDFKDGYLFSQNSEQDKQIEKILESSKVAGVNIEYSQQLEVSIPATKILKFKNQGQIHPVKYIYGLAKSFEKFGGRILCNCRVLNVSEKENNFLEVETSLQKIYAKNLVYATHIPPGVNILHFRNAPYRSYAVACKLEDENYPSSVIYDLYNPYHYYRTHIINGEKFLIAGGNDHKTGEEKNTENCFTDLKNYLNKYFKIKEFSFEWSSQFFEPVDGLPYIGHLPGNPENVYVATGYGGNGITYSHVAAKLLSDMITGNENADAVLYKPSRVKPVAGFNEFVKNAADVIGNLASSIINFKDDEEFQSVKNGEGKIISYNGNKIAVYRDDTGKLFKLNPACTHIKCEVAFNSSEKVWECPCHGSRFSITGEMFTGPARRNMENL